MPHTQRITHARGSARDVGAALGRKAGPRLERTIARYLRHGPGRHGCVDWTRLRQGALQWLRTLPTRFQEEMEGLAEGSGVPLQRVAEWSFVEQCVSGGCSAFVCDLAGDLWVGRNNDICVPDLWGYVTIREVEGRIPTISFGMESETFTATGINRERLWLHYHWLPAQEAAVEGGSEMLPFVLLTTALETCSTLEEVELLLSETDRSGGMMLFAVDGKRGTGAVYECSRRTVVKRQLEGRWMAGTNHACAYRGQQSDDSLASSSRRRYGRMVEMLSELLEPGRVAEAPRDLIGILADPAVEQRGEDSGTAYANVVCPGREIVWYTFGGYPAASAGNWARVAWPWQPRSTR